MQILDSVDAASLRSDIPAFGPGDNVKVHVNITEGNRSRIQVFQGVVIGRSGDGVRETFTVRKISFQVGVERKFPVHSPVIDHIEVVTRGDVRRAKLYYLRDLRGKKAKIKEKRDSALTLSDDAPGLAPRGIVVSGSHHPGRASDNSTRRADGWPRVCEP